MVYAELRDVMYDAGFTRVDTYWEGTDEDGERPVEKIG